MAKFRDLRELVPDFELCEKIPPGEFEDSVFGWRYYSPRIGLEPDWEVVPRAGNDVDCPAPTLQEIMEKIEGSICVHAKTEWTAYRYITSHKNDPMNPSTAAMKLWLELNPKKQEN